MRRWLRNAFALETAERGVGGAVDQELLAHLADTIVRYGLATPALLLLQSSLPLNFVISQWLVFQAPVVRVLCVRSAGLRAQYEALIRVLEERGGMERLCAAIEARAQDVGDSSG